jgi:hypothetical protein
MKATRLAPICKYAAAWVLKSSKRLLGSLVAAFIVVFFQLLNEIRLLLVIFPFYFLSLF